MYFARSFGAQDNKRNERFHLVVVVVVYYLQMFPAILSSVLFMVLSTSDVNKFYIKEVYLNFNIGLVIHFNIVEL